MSGKRGKRQWLDLRIFQKSLKEIKNKGQSTEDGACVNNEINFEDTDISETTETSTSKKGTSQATVDRQKKGSPNKRRSSGRGHRNSNLTNLPKQLEIRNVKGSMSMKGKLSNSGTNQEQTNDQDGDRKTLSCLKTINVAQTLQDRSLEEDWSKELIDMSLKENDDLGKGKENKTCTAIHTAKVSGDVKSENKSDTPDDVKEFFKDCGENRDTLSSLLWPLQSTPIKKQNKKQDNSCENEILSDCKMEDNCILDIGNVIKGDMQLKQEIVLPQTFVIETVDQAISAANESETRKENEKHDTVDKPDNECKGHLVAKPPCKAAKHDNDDYWSRNEEKNDSYLKSQRHVIRERRGGFSRGPRFQTAFSAVRGRRPLSPLGRSRRQLSPIARSRISPSPIARYRRPSPVGRSSRPPALASRFHSYIRGRGTWVPSRRPSRGSFRGSPTPRSDLTFVRDCPPRFRHSRETREDRPVNRYYESIKMYPSLLSLETKERKVDKTDAVWVLPSSEDWGSELDEGEVMDDRDGLCCVSQDSLSLNHHRKASEHESDEIVVENTASVGIDEEKDIDNEIEVTERIKEPYLPPPPPSSEGDPDKTQELVLNDDNHLCCVPNTDEVEMNIVAKSIETLSYVLENDSDSLQYSDMGLYVCNPDFSGIEVPDSEPISQENIDFCFECTRLSQDQEKPNLPDTDCDEGHLVSDRETQHQYLSGSNSRGEHNKVQSAYETHRHLEPSCTQPSNYDIPDHDMYTSANHCFPWHHEYYMKGQYAEEWYTKQMQYYDWLDYQRRCYGIVSPEDWQRAEQYRQQDCQWRRTDFPHPFTQAAESERREKTYQEQRISDFWQDRMPHWVKCQEATVQTSPRIPHTKSKDQPAVRNNLDLSDIQNKQEQTLDKNANNSAEVVNQKKDITIIRVNRDSISREVLMKENLKNCKVDAKRCRTESAMTISHEEEPSTLCDKGDNSGECKCKSEEVKYLVWRMCNCPVGNPPKLQRVLHHGLEELSQDLGYHSVDSVDESGLYSLSYKKFVPSVPSASSTPMLKKEIGHLEKSMSGLGLTPSTPLSQKLSINALKPPPGFQPMVYPVMRGGRFSGPPMRLANSSSSMLKEPLDNADKCCDPCDPMDTDLCNNNLPQTTVSQSNETRNNIEKDINNNKCLSDPGHKPTKLVEQTYESLISKQLIRDDASSRGSVRSCPSQENSFMELPASLTADPAPAARANLPEPGQRAGPGSVMSALNTYSEAIMAIEKTLKAGPVPSCGHIDSDHTETSLRDTLQDYKLDSDQKVHSDSSPKSAGEEDSSVCDADNESDASLDHHVIRMAVISSQDVIKNEGNIQTQDSRAVLPSVAMSNLQQHGNYPHLADTRQHLIPSGLRPRSHFLRDSPIPRFNYNREEFPFHSPFPWSMGEQKAGNIATQLGHLSQDTPNLRNSGGGSSRVECNKVLSAYDNHRHLEPSCTQPMSSECSAHRPPISILKRPSSSTEVKANHQAELQAFARHSQYGKSFPMVQEPTAEFSEAARHMKSKCFPKLVDYGFTEDSSNESEDQEQMQCKKKREDKGEHVERCAAQNMNMLLSEKASKSGPISENSGVESGPGFTFSKKTDYSEQTSPLHPYLRSRRGKPRQKILKSFTASDHPHCSTNHQYSEANKPYSPSRFLSKKRSIEEILSDEAGRTETNMKEANTTADTSLFSPEEARPPFPPLPPFPASPFWGMYMPKSNSALTGNKPSPPRSYSAAVNSGLSSPAQRVFNNRQIRRSWPMSPSFTASHSESDSEKITPYLSDWKINFKDVHSFGVKYIDTHCHLDFLFSREGFRGNLAGYMEAHPETFPEMFEGCVAVFCNPVSFNPNSGLWLDVAEERNVWIAMGCHPKMAMGFSEAAEIGLRQCLRHSKCIALGEIGLDYSGNFRQHEFEQKRVFRKQLEIALTLNKPLVIHCRQAEDDCLEILKEMVPRDYKIHCHCFTLGYANARRWLDAFDNLYIGLTPLVTYTSATPSHDLARKIPLNKLLLETDAPYFIPRCIPKSDMPLSNPGVAITVAREVAKYQEISVAAVLRHCRLNTKFMYGI